MSKSSSLPPKGKFKIVEVLWLDSEHHSDWESLPSVLEEQETTSLECSSVGYLVAEKDDRIILATSFTIEEESETQISYFITIPRVAIVSQRELRKR